MSVSLLHRCLFDEEIAQIYGPIDPSELPEDLIEDETAVFDYIYCFSIAKTVSLCDADCRNFWFRLNLAPMRSGWSIIFKATSG